MEIANALLILHHHLTIKDGRLAAEFAGSLDDAAIGIGPVITVPGKGSDLAPIDDDQGAIAVVLDLVNPTGARGRFRYKGGNFQWDEAERRGRYEDHLGPIAPTDGIGNMSGNVSQLP